MEEKLIALKRKVELAKQQVHQLEGQKEQLLNQLQEDFKCSTVEEAQNVLTRLKKQQDMLEKQIAEQVTKIETDYGL